MIGFRVKGLQGLGVAATIDAQPQAQTGVSGGQDCSFGFDVNRLPHMMPATFALRLPLFAKCGALGGLRDI